MNFDSEYTYFIRQTAGMDVDARTWQKLWDARRIAIHFPSYKKLGQIKDRDNPSTNPDDYGDPSSKGAVGRLAELARTGGFVCAEYAKPERATVVGYVRPRTKIKLLHGKWGEIWGNQGRQAVLKTLKLEHFSVVHPDSAVNLVVGRPRKGTILKWPKGEHKVKAALGKRYRQTLNTLSPTDQEVLCSELLRTSAARSLGLPRIAHLQAPVGRTMRDIDIYGVTTTGRKLFGQVTFCFDSGEDFQNKLEALKRFRRGGRNVLLLFANCERRHVRDGIQIVPLAEVYKRFQKTEYGKLWLRCAR